METSGRSCQADPGFEVHRPSSLGRSMDPVKIYKPNSKVADLSPKNIFGNKQSHRWYQARSKYWWNHQGLAAWWNGPNLQPWTPMKVGPAIFFFASLKLVVSEWLMIRMYPYIHKWMNTKKLLICLCKHKQMVVLFQKETFRFPSDFLLVCS